MRDLAEGVPGAGDDALSALRWRVLRQTLTVLALAVPVISAIIFIQAIRLGELNTRTVVMCAFTLLFPLLRLALAGIGFRPAAVALLGLLLVCTFLVAARGGVAVGNVSLSVIALLLSILFFGRRGAVVTLLGILVAFSFAGFLVLKRRRSETDVRFREFSPEGAS